jgi:hypothetical protein
MSDDTPSEVHEKAATVIERVESDEFGIIQSTDLDTGRGRYPELTITLKIKPGRSERAGSDTATEEVLRDE